MKLSKMKIELEMARKNLTVTNLSKRYGVSRARMHVILNSREVTVMCAWRIANALEVDVKEIVED